MADDPREPVRDDPLLREAAEVAAVLAAPEPAAELSMTAADRSALARRLAAGPRRVPPRASARDAGPRRGWIAVAAIAAAVCLMWVVRARVTDPAPLPSYQVEVGGAARELGDRPLGRAVLQPGDPLVVVLTPQQATAPVDVEMYLSTQAGKLRLAPQVEHRDGGLIVLRGIVGDELALAPGENTLELALGACDAGTSGSGCQRFELEVEVRP